MQYNYYTDGSSVCFQRNHRASFHIILPSTPMPQKFRNTTHPSIPFALTVIVTSKSRKVLVFSVLDCYQGTVLLYKQGSHHASHSIGSDLETETCLAMGLASDPGPHLICRETGLTGWSHTVAGLGLVVVHHCGV